MVQAGVTLSIRFQIRKVLLDSLFKELSPTQRVTLTEPRLNHATITSILPEVDAQTRTQTVVLALETGAAARVTPGQTVRLNLTEQVAAEGIWLPTEALTEGIRGLWTAYVVVPEADAKVGGKTGDDISYLVEPQSVEVVHQAGDRVFVTGTLQPGDVVVASGSHRLVSGQRVRPTGGF